jgi:hypothetical protein
MVALGSAPNNRKEGADMNRLLLVLALTAWPAAADTVIEFSVSGIVFNGSESPVGVGRPPGFSTGVGVNLSVTGVNTPQNASVTVDSCCGGGFNWNPTVTSSDANNWYLSATGIIIEAGFDFSGSAALQPGDIGTFMYSGPGGTQAFAMSMDGAPLEFDAPVAIGIDPRLAAFYGLGPPCLVNPLAAIPAAACVGTSFVYGQFIGTGTPVAGDPGQYTFNGEIAVVITPEPESVLLLGTVVVFIGILVKRKVRPQPQIPQAASASPLM